MYYGFSSYMFFVMAFVVFFTSITRNILYGNCAEKTIESRGLVEMEMCVLCHYFVAVVFYRCQGEVYVF